EFGARVMYGASSVATVLSLVITALGRDLLTLIGLVIVMFIQDPILSVIGIFVMTPSILIVRHLIKRVRNITLTQFAGGARFLEALQETAQGLRIVKALNLENEMRRR